MTIKELPIEPMLDIFTFKPNFIANVIAMRTLIAVSLMFCMFCSKSLAQTVPCFSNQDPSYWKIGPAWNSKLVSACHEQDLYNCHGFVLGHFENSCPNYGWNTPAPSPYLCPNPQGQKAGSQIKNNVGFIRVCNVSDAKIVYYKTLISSSDHSAIKDPTVTQGTAKYVSKYGADGPLVSHDLHGSWYHLIGDVDIPQTEYWTYLGSVKDKNPSVPVQVGGSKIYGVEPATGVTYSWSSVSGKFQIASGQGTATVTINPYYSGTDDLKLEVTGCNGMKKTQFFQIVIPPTCLSGTYTVGSSGGHPINTANSISIGQVVTNIVCPGAASIQWIKTSGSLSFMVWNVKDVLFNMTSGASISFDVKARNSSNQVISSRSVTFYNFGSFMVYPNPSHGMVKVDLNPDLTFEYDLVSMKEMRSVSCATIDKDGGIDLSSVSPGEYVLRILFEGKVVAEQRIIISK